MKIRIYGVKIDLGAGRRGVDMGPTAMRLSGVVESLKKIGHEVEDFGDIEVGTSEAVKEGDPKARYLDEISRVCEKLAVEVERARTEGCFPLVLGGDHSIAVGTIAGVSAYERKTKGKHAVIWIDAHADMNTPDTSPSGNIHGMPLATCLGFGSEKLTNIMGFSPKLDPEQVYLVGIRDLDRKEKEFVKKSGVNFYTMSDIDKVGIYSVLEEILGLIEKRDIRDIHVSFDIDGLDPAIAPGVGTPVRGGLSYREAHLMMETLAESGRVKSCEVAELNPFLDKESQSARVAVELVSSLLGKQIL